LQIANGFVITFFGGSLIGLFAQLANLFGTLPQSEILLHLSYQLTGPGVLAVHFQQLQENVAGGGELLLLHQTLGTIDPLGHLLFL